MKQKQKKQIIIMGIISLLIVVLFFIFHNGNWSNSLTTIGGSGDYLKCPSYCYSNSDCQPCGPSYVCVKISNIGRSLGECKLHRGTPAKDNNQMWIWVLVGLIIILAAYMIIREKRK